MELKERKMLEELRDFRNSLEKDFKKQETQNKKTEIKDIIYLGDAKWKDKINGNELSEKLYIVEKEVIFIGEDGKKEVKDISNYYLGDKCVGGFLGDSGEPIFNEIIKLSEPEKIKSMEDLIKSITKDTFKLNSLKNLEQKQLEEVAEKLGIKHDEIEKLSEIDLNDLEEAEENLQSEEVNKEEETLSKEEVNKISTKTEISLNQKVTDNKNISDLLGINGQGYVKIAVVYSDKLENKNSTRFSFVGIKQDGSAEKIDTLKQSHGINSAVDIKQTNRDGTQVQEKRPKSFYSIEGAEDGALAIDVGPMGTIETSYVRVPKQDNKVGLGIPIETQSIRPTTNEVRELMNEKRNPRVMEEIDRTEKHEEHGDENITLKDIDDNPYNNECEKVEIDSEYIEKCIDEIWTGDVEAVFTREEVKESLQIAQQNNTQNLPFEQIVEKVKQEMEYDADMLPSREKRE